jgi:His-Xaa-Ser system protein HxsD
MAASYKFTDKCVVLIRPLEEGYVGIYFQAKEEQSVEEIPRLLREYCNEVLDQQVRLDLEKRYGSLRDTIFNFAFCPIEKYKEKE